MLFFFVGWKDSGGASISLSCETITFEIWKQILLNKSTKRRRNWTKKSRTKGMLQQGKRQKNSTETYGLSCSTSWVSLSSLLLYMLLSLETISTSDRENGIHTHTTYLINKQSTEVSRIAHCKRLEPTKAKEQWGKWIYEMWKCALHVNGFVSVCVRRAVWFINDRWASVQLQCHILSFVLWCAPLLCVWLCKKGDGLWWGGCHLQPLDERK